MKFNFLKMNSILLLTWSLIGMSLGSMNNFDCNGYWDGSDWYGVDICFPSKSGSYISSEEYVCDESGTLWQYEYDTIDCTGNYSWGSPSDYSDESGAYCSSSYSDSCAYMITYYYDADSDCDESGTYYGDSSSYVTGKCVNTTDGSGSSSEYYTCSQDSYNVKHWSSSATCSGDHDWQYTYDPAYLASWGFFDYKLYCSSAGDYSECNEDAAFTMNKKYIISMVAAFIVAIYNQI